MRTLETLSVAAVVCAGKKIQDCWEMRRESREIFCNLYLKNSLSLYEKLFFSYCYFFLFYFLVYSILLSSFVLSFLSSLLPFCFLHSLYITFFLWTYLSLLCFLLLCWSSLFFHSFLLFISFDHHSVLLFTFSKFFFAS